MANEPQLQKHFETLEKDYPKGHPAIMAFNELINSCFRGNFNTPELNAIKRTFLIKE